MSADRNPGISSILYPEVPGKPDWVDTNENHILTTHRSFEKVMGGLLLPEKYLASSHRVISVGEGLSYFAQTLQEKYPVSVIAVDPIYSAGRSICVRQEDLVNWVLKEKFHGRVWYRTDFNLDTKESEMEEMKGNLGKSAT